MNTAPAVRVGKAAATTITALPMTVNLDLYAGDDFYLDLTVTNPDGTAADLSTAVATAQVRAKATDPDPPLAAFVATITGNVIRLHLASTASQQLTGPAVWDCQVATPDITTLAAGTVTMSGDVTRP
jgi:hypothetical protein